MFKWLSDQIRSVYCKFNVMQNWRFLLLLLRFAISFSSSIFHTKIFSLAIITIKLSVHFQAVKCSAEPTKRPIDQQNCIVQFTYKFMGQSAKKKKTSGMLPMTTKSTRRAYIVRRAKERENHIAMSRSIRYLTHLNLTTKYCLFLRMRGQVNEEKKNVKLSMEFNGKTE